MVKEKIRCDRLQDEGETCGRCGSIIDNNESRCDSCDNDPRKDEWHY